MDNQVEEWRWAVGYEGLYKISNKGNLWCSPREHCKGGLLVPCVGKRGYYNHLLYDSNGKKHMEYMHRLVAKAFVKNEGGYNCVDNIDRNKLNNNVDNLRWVSHVSNNRNTHWFDGTKFKERCNESGNKDYAQIAESNGIKRGTFYRRIQNGWSLEDAITREVNRGKHYDKQRL